MANMVAECTMANNINGKMHDTVKRGCEGECQRERASQKEGAGQRGRGRTKLVLKTKGEGTFPKSNAKNLEHSRAYRKAFQMP